MLGTGNILGHLYLHSFIIPTGQGHNTPSQGGWEKCQTGRGEILKKIQLDSY